jgi:hypothetical protein
MKTSRKEKCCRFDTYGMHTQKVNLKLNRGGQEFAKPETLAEMEADFSAWVLPTGDT